MADKALQELDTTHEAESHDEGDSAEEIESK